MKRQRGVIATGWLYLAGVLLVLGAIWGITATASSYLEGVRAEAVKAGRDECDAAYKLRDNAQLRTALDRVKTLEEAARKTERAHAAELTSIGNQLTKEKANAKARKNKFDADIASGALVVRGDAFQAGACPAVSGGGAGSAPGAGAGGGDGPPACELSAAARSDLLAVGDDADDTAIQLAAAQAVIVEDRRVCGAGKEASR
jgi:hypothetical protein